MGKYLWFPVGYEPKAYQILDTDIVIVVVRTVVEEVESVQYAIGQLDNLEEARWDYARLNTPAVEDLGQFSVCIALRQELRTKGRSIIYQVGLRSDPWHSIFQIKWAKPTSEQQ